MIHVYLLTIVGFINFILLFKVGIKIAKCSYELSNPSEKSIDSGYPPSLQKSGTGININRLQDLDKTLKNKYVNLTLTELNEIKKNILFVLSSSNKILNDTSLHYYLYNTLHGTNLLLYYDNRVILHYDGEFCFIWE